MIKMNLKEIFELVPVLQTLSQNNFKGPMAFKIGRMIRELDKELTLFEQSRQKIADKYGQKDEEGNFITTENGQIRINEPEKCNAELQELLDTIVEINADKLPLEAFNDIEISPFQANALNTIIEY